MRTAIVAVCAVAFVAVSAVLLEGSVQAGDAEIISILPPWPEEIPRESNIKAVVEGDGTGLPLLPPNVHPDAKQGKITKVVDGNTVDIDAIRYRLALIDTPERGEDGFSEATSTLKALCPVGSRVYYDDDSTNPLNTYGLRLGVIWCEGNDYSATAGEYLHGDGHLEEFNADFCDTTRAATEPWAQATGDWFYHEACN